MEYIRKNLFNPGSVFFYCGCIVIVFCISGVKAEYKNCISAVVGVPDYMNLKYSRTIKEKYEITVTTGLTPGFSVIIPGIGIGYRIYKHNNVHLLISAISSYWPGMEFAEPASQNNPNTIYQDWLHLAVRPDLVFDLYTFRFAFGLGYDSIFEYLRKNRTIEFAAYQPYYSIAGSIGFLF